MSGTLTPHAYSMTMQEAKASLAQLDKTLKACQTLHQQCVTEHNKYLQNSSDLSDPQQRKSILDRFGEGWLQRWITDKQIAVLSNLLGMQKLCDRINTQHQSLGRQLELLRLGVVEMEACDSEYYSSRMSYTIPLQAKLQSIEGMRLYQELGDDFIKMKRVLKRTSDEYGYSSTLKPVGIAMYYAYSQIAPATPSDRRPFERLSIIDAEQCDKLMLVPGMDALTWNLRAAATMLRDGKAALKRFTDELGGYDQSLLQKLVDNQTWAGESKRRRIIGEQVYRGLKVMDAYIEVVHCQGLVLEAKAALTNALTEVIVEHTKSDSQDASVEPLVQNNCLAADALDHALGLLHTAIGSATFVPISLATELVYSDKVPAQTIRPPK